MTTIDYARRVREWKWYLSTQSNQELFNKRAMLEAWMVDPVHTYGTGPTAQAELDYDRQRLITMDEEIARRGLPTVV